jgi:hypothetical protein
VLRFQLLICLTTLFARHTFLHCQYHFKSTLLKSQVNSCNILLLIPWSRVLLEKLIVFQLVKKYPEFYWSRKFIIVFTTARHRFLTWARCIQSTPSHQISPRFILILFFHLSLGLPSAMCHLSHHLWFDHPNNILWRIRIMKVLITQFSPAFRHFAPIVSKYCYTLSNGY